MKGAMKDEPSAWRVGYLSCGFDVLTLTPMNIGRAISDHVRGGVAIFNASISPAVLIIISVPIASETIGSLNMKMVTSTILLRLIPTRGSYMTVKIRTQPVQFLHVASRTLSSPTIPFIRQYNNGASSTPPKPGQSQAQRNEGTGAAGQQGRKYSEWKFCDLFRHPAREAWCTRAGFLTLFMR